MHVVLSVVFATCQLLKAQTKNEEGLCLCVLCQLLHEMRAPYTIVIVDTVIVTIGSLMIIFLVTAIRKQQHQNRSAEHGLPYAIWHLGATSNALQCSYDVRSSLQSLS